MRVISGKLGGLRIDSPKGHITHPMSEKMRGAIFNALGDVSNLSFLDCYSGSGAIAFEAISRLAKPVVAIDNNKKSIMTIKANAKQLGVGDGIKTISASVESWLSTNTLIFDIIVADPPYDRLKADVINRLSKNLSKKGLLVLSWPKEPLPLLDGLKIVNQKDYGDSMLAFYCFA